MRPAFTIDRINALLKTLCLQPVTIEILSGGFGWIWHLPIDPKKKITQEPFNPTPGHAILDRIDKHVGIDTRKTCFEYWTGAGYQWRPALLGERLRRLERHVYNNRAPTYFHLGAQAEEYA